MKKFSITPVLAEGLTPKAITLQVSVFKKLPVALCGFFLVTYTLFFLIRGNLALFYPYPLEYGEGALFYEAGQLFRGNFNPNSLYTSNLAPPYLSGLYGPLFQYLQALLMFVTGPASIAGGRLISFLASLAISYLLYRIGFSQLEANSGFNRRLLALFAALTPLATLPFYYWGVLAKTDMLALALALAATERASQAIKQPSFRAGPYIGAGLCSGLAILTKQTALAAPIAIILTLSLKQQWRGLTVYMAVSGGVGGLGALSLQIITNGKFFTHLFSYNAQPYSLALLGINFNYFFTPHILLVLLAGFWLIRSFSFARRGPAQLWNIYLIAALLVSLTSGRIGSFFNHYLESLVLVSLTAWWQIAHFLKIQPTLRIRKWSLTIAPIILLFMAVQLAMLTHVPVYIDVAGTPGPGRFDRAQRMAQLLDNLSPRGPMLAQDSGWQAALGITSDLDDPFIFSLLEQQGTWDNSLLAQRLESGYYRTILVRLVNFDFNEEVYDPTVSDLPIRSQMGFLDSQISQIIKEKFVPYRRFEDVLIVLWKDDPLPGQ